MPGVEYHITNYKRTSVYVGGEIGFEFQRASYEESNNDNNEKIEYKGFNDFDNYSANMFKVGVFTGIDVYLLKNLYLGAEVGLQYATGKNPDATVKYTDTTGQTTENKYKDHVKISNFGFYCLPSVRIGWNF